MTAARATAERLSARIRGYGIDLGSGTTEVPLRWVDSGVTCSGRLDFLLQNMTQIIDVKTTEGSVHPDACAAALCNQAGAIQDCAYRRAVEILRPDLAGRVDVLFLFCQMVEPFAVTPVRCGGTMRQLGALRWEAALRIWERCLRLDEWPSHVSGPVFVEAPAWAMTKELMREEEASNAALRGDE